MRKNAAEHQIALCGIGLRTANIGAAFDENHKLILGISQTVK